jgi:hypothetical protein
MGVNRRRRRPHQSTEQELARAAARTRLRPVLERYVSRLAYARHFAHHPQPRPEDAARSENHLDEAQRMEAEVRSLLHAVLPDGPDGGGAASPGKAPGFGYGRGLTFGIGLPLGRIGTADRRPVDRRDRLARRADVEAEAGRYLRLLGRAESLAGAPRPLDTDAGSVARQLAAARRAERRLKEGLEALTK